ncbi:MAG: Ig-like domain-containing protein [Enterobacterales bacterium]|nr:Ig-like domain-containing protein [Enterobacterales bacterium]
MDWLKKVPSLTSHLSIFASFLLVSWLTACSGGSFSEGAGTGGTGGTATKTVTVAISSTSVDAANPATVTATVSDGTTLFANELVTFTTTIGNLNPASGTALTDVNGIATIELQAGNVAGAGEITASIGNGELGKIGFTTAGDGGSSGSTISISLQLVSAATGLPTQTVTSSDPGRIIASVNGITTQTIVTFNTDIGNIPIPTAITDANNQATVDILAASSLGAGTISASVSSGETASIVFAIGATNLQMGSGNPFQSGVADVSVAQISAGGTATISVTIVDQNGTPFTDPVDVVFSSTCSIATPTQAIISSPITTVNGTALTTYLATGCVGDDPINVQANAGGINLSATGSINVLPADAGSIEFVSATPEQIAIKGAGGLGGSESSTVVFRVRDVNGNPINGRLVNFSLNSTVGGISLSPLSATTNAQGLAQTIVNSGTVATSVRVTAEIDQTLPPIVSQSTNLVVSTGIPDQDSFTISAETLNPEAWDIDGTTVNITARLADAFNNPVPDGTAVSFTAEGGSIGSSCTTLNGACTVVWTSQFPRPQGKELLIEGAVPHSPNTMGQRYGGRATILATAIGEESFPDLNGNGRFDTTEETTFAGNNISGLPYDLPEAFIDHNEDGIFDITQLGGELETPSDFNANGLYDIADGQYNGVLCGDSTICATSQSLNVRRSLVLVMSGSNPQFATTLPVGGSAVVPFGNEGVFSVFVSDLHNQPMPKGTKIEFIVNGNVDPNSLLWPNDNNNGGREWSFSTAISGPTTVAIKITTPSNLVTIYTIGTYTN